MTMRTTSKTVTFHRPFWLKGVDRLLPPAERLAVFLSLHGREGPGAVAHHPPLLAARIARIT